MPWKAVPFEDAPARRRLSGHFAVRGIPMLVIINADGRVLTFNGRAAVARDPSGQGFPWEGAKGDGCVRCAPMCCRRLYLCSPM